MVELQEVFNEICEFDDEFNKQLKNSDPTYVAKTSVDICNKIEMELNYFSLDDLKNLMALIRDRVQKKGSSLIMRTFYESVNGRIYVKEKNAAIDSFRRR